MRKSGTSPNPLIAVRVPEKMRDEIRAVAQANDRNMSAEIRQAIKAYVEAEQSKAAA